MKRDLDALRGQVQQEPPTRRGRLRERLVRLESQYRSMQEVLQQMAAKVRQVS